VRWRNPGLLLLLIIREMFRPFIYWYLFDVFERDLRRSMPQPYSKEKLDVRIYEGTNDLQKAIEELASLDDLCAADIEARLGRGDVVAVAYAARKARLHVAHFRERNGARLRNNLDDGSGRSASIWSLCAAGVAWARNSQLG